MGEDRHPRADRPVRAARLPQRDRAAAARDHRRAPDDRQLVRLARRRLRSAAHAQPRAAPGSALGRDSASRRQPAARRRRRADTRAARSRACDGTTSGGDSSIRFPSIAASNHLPWFEASLQGTAPPQVDVKRRYAQLTTVGADVAVPLPVFTVKAEAAWFHSDTERAGEYMLYVVQVERQSGEWLFIGGYAGEYEETADAARHLSAGSRTDARLHRACVADARCESQPRIRKCHPAERRRILRAGGVHARLRRPLARHRQRHRVRRHGRRFPRTLRPQLFCAPVTAIQLLTRCGFRLQPEDGSSALPCPTPTIRVGTFRRRPSYLLVSRRR